jgi:MoaA/NifB/PqqE/SkfB family radical SAM enzyme
MNFLYTLPGKSGPKNNNIRSEDLRVLNPGCGAGRLFCAITPDGGVKPCVFWDDSCCEFNVRIDRLGKSGTAQGYLDR